MKTTFTSRGPNVGMAFYSGFLRMPRMLLDTPSPDPKPAPAPAPDDKDKEIAELKAKLAAYDKPKPDPVDDPSLAEKARLEAEKKEKAAAETKNMEKAVSFNLGAKAWLKENASLLPQNIAGIFEQAEKENFDTAHDKASTIKVNLVTEFFAQQSNLDLLTASQKQALAEFNKLTKNVKQERVQQIYDAIFEPTLETLRKVKKAEALQKGLAEPSDAEDAYKQKLIKMSRQHHLREKQ